MPPRQFSSNRAIVRKPRSGSGSSAKQIVAETFCSLQANRTWRVRAAVYDVEACGHNDRLGAVRFSSRGGVDGHAYEPKGYGKSKAGEGCKRASADTGGQILLRRAGVESGPREANKPRRHSWSEKHRLPYETQQVCWHCGILKVTRHESNMHWIEFRDGDGNRIKCKATPPCDAREVVS